MNVEDWEIYKSSGGPRYLSWQRIVHRDCVGGSMFYSGPPMAYSHFGATHCVACGDEIPQAIRDAASLVK